jgi:hypothetical protein
MSPELGHRAVPITRGALVHVLTVAAAEAHRSIRRRCGRTRRRRDRQHPRHRRNSRGNVRHDRTGRGGHRPLRRTRRGQSRRGRVKRGHDWRDRDVRSNCRRFPPGVVGSGRRQAASQRNDEQGDRPGRDSADETPDWLHVVPPPEPPSRSRCCAVGYFTQTKHRRLTLGSSKSRNNEGPQRDQRRSPTRYRPRAPPYGARGTRQFLNASFTFSPAFFRSPDT